MIKKMIFLTVLVVMSLSCSRYKDYSDIAFEEKHSADWENPAVNEINREFPRAWFVPFGNAEELDPDNKWASSLMQSLNGDWLFHFSENPSERPAWFFRDDFDTHDWGTIPVPSNYEM